MDGRTAGPPVVVEHMGKRFGDVAAVDDLSFTVEAGQVCGLLGPNGAGKTTTLRMLVGLIHPSSGSARLLGEPAGPSARQLRRVGALIEEAAFVPHLSGIKNLRLWWAAGGQSWREADVEGALAVAGLGDAVARKVGTYSQGMKQRLGLARLLLGRPDLLILDEPTNGLDPGEIREIRQLLRRLADGGATVLLSSHHLPEVEQTCTHAVIMNRGRLVKSGTVSALVAGGGAVYLDVDDVEMARSVLSALPMVTSVATQGDGLRVELRDGRRSDLVSALVTAGVRVETVTPVERLEDAFLDLLATGGAK